MIMRCKNNPLITPKDVKPSREDFYVEGVFNCGAVKYNNQILLLCRVAESVVNHNKDKVLIPVVDKDYGNDYIRIIEIKKVKISIMTILIVEAYGLGTLRECEKYFILPHYHI